MKNRWPALKGRFAMVFREARHAAYRAWFLVKDFARMVDVNDFGRHLSRNIGKKFIAWSGVVTVFSLVGQYTKMIVIGGEMDTSFTENFWNNLVANFIFFGIPGGLLLAATQLFSFFNRANYFAAQANYLNLLEMPKRAPAQLDRLIDKLWSYVYRGEHAIYARGRSHEAMCRRVEDIQRRKVSDESRLVAEITAATLNPGGEPAPQGGASAPVREVLDTEAYEKYRAFIHQGRHEGYYRLVPWTQMALREKCSVLEDIILEETVREFSGEGLQYCKAGFKFNAKWTLTHPMHLNLKHRKSGLDLKLVEDWLDGAFFDLTDVKLIEEYMAESTIKSAKLQARVPVFPFILVQGFRNFTQRIWTYMLFGITSKRIGRYLNHLNQHYVSEKSDLFDRDYFKAEAFFWRSKAYDSTLREQIGDEALGRLQVLRERWLFLTFGRMKRPRTHPGQFLKELNRKLNRNSRKAILNATRILKRLFAGSVYNIHELRLLYDPDYVILMAGRTDSEFERMGLEPNYIERHRRGVMKKYRDVLDFQARLPGLLDPEAMQALGLEHEIDPEAERAVRIAYHINEKGFRTLVDRHGRGGGPALQQAVHRRLVHIVENKESYSRKIRQLKTFETLAIHHLKTYTNTIIRLYREIQNSYRQALAERIERKKNKS